MTTANSSRNGSSEIGNVDSPLDDNSFHESVFYESDNEGAVDIVLLSEDIEAGEQEEIDTTPDVESALEQPAVDLSSRSTQPLTKKAGKRAFSVANRMAQATNIENLYQIAVTELRKRFQVERALIYQFRSETEGTVIAESQNPDYSPMLGKSLPAIAFGMSDAKSYKQRPSVAINDTSEETVTPYQMQLFNQFQTKASLSLPIFLEDQLWGLLVVQQCSGTRQWNENEISFLYLVASELQVNLLPLSFQSERQLLTTLSNKIRQTSDREAIFKSTTRDLRKFLSVDRVAICQFRQDYSLQFIFESKTGEVEPMLDVVLEDSHLQSQEGGIFRQSKPFVVHHVEQDSSLTPCHMENLTDFGIQACAIVAIYQGQKLWGLLGAYQHGGARYWEDNDIRLLSQVGDLVSVSLHQSELLSEMDRAAENQEALPEIINKISNTAYTEKIYQTAVEEVRQLLNVEHACIYKFRPDYFGDFIYESHSGGWPNLVGSAWEDTYVQKHQGGRFQNTEQPFLADDIYTAGLSECHIQTLEYFKVRSFLIVAIRQEGKLWGLLSTFQHSGSRHWLESDVKVLQEISRQMEASLKGADYIAQLQAQSAEMTKTAQMGRSVAELVPQILQANDTEQIFKTAHKGLRRLLKCDRIAIYRFNADWSHDLLYPSGSSDAENSGFGQTLSAIWPKTDLQESQGGPYRNQEDLVVNNIYAANHSPLEIDLLEANEIHAYMTSPVFKEGQLWGLISVYQEGEPRSWAESEINGLKQVGLQLGIAMQQVDYLEQLNQTTQREQLLSKISERLRQVTDLPKVLKATARDIREMLGADRVGLYQFDPETNYLVGEFVVEDIAAGVRSAMATKIQDHCFAEDQAENYQKGRYWVVNDVQTLDLPDCLMELLAELQVRASLVVPLLKGDVLWGLFAIHQCQGPREWKEIDVQFAHRIGAQLNVALQQADYLSQVQAQTAKLTETAEREKASKEQLQQQVIQLLQAVGPALQGDLTVRAQVTETQVGTVASAYNSTLQSLQKIVLQVQAAANKVSETSKQSETSADAVKQQAQQQAKSLSQALDRVQQMMDSTEAVAQDAQQVEAATQQTNQIVHQGDAAMNRTVDGIMAIRSTVAETSQRIKRLSESSQKVSKIVNLISNFTTQTQLLALNASIEATRAGEYGRGFVVVADEVRSLARQSAAAATEIEQFVQEIQVGTAEVSTAMETGIQQVAQGTDMVTDARQNLTAIVEATSQISQLIAEITQTTHKQADEFKLVTKTMSAATEIADQTSESSNDLAQSIQQVLETAAALQSSAGKFKVE
ncbi:GAF domain-containing protein [cf. Phormidesmis sp. LEGE 11477]|uniref:GAF domain-containing protein n=1 Tax=cf. Phormidesmis sp. LEGE 11477 TaxID=1828680 RepID=UPI0018829AA1|nr:GAF domain-containing protein [cf. Phormidesmis sp. LEGE 11477]MBE9060972.1 GAF domain-containing protein [cf. Phormidesmis sp. LEGE 11477]